MDVRMKTKYLHPFFLSVSENRIKIWVRESG